MGSAAAQWTTATATPSTFEGVNARHMGVELNVNWIPVRWLNVEGMLSLGSGNGAPTLQATSLTTTMANHLAKLRMDM